MKQIHALLPRFFSRVGHIFHYHIAVEKAVKLMGWTYTAYIPKKTNLPNLPPNWLNMLANDISEKPKGFYLKLKVLIENMRPFWSILKKIENQEDAIMFIEHFELQHLASLSIVLFFLSPRFHFWILYRYELENRQIKSGLYRFFLWYMRKKLGNNKVKCFTDSELLAKSLEKDLHCFIQVVPIPHTEGAKKHKADKKEKKVIERIQFWWPGGLIREDKGLSKILKLFHLLRVREDIRLVVAENSREIFASFPNADFIPSDLSREEYVIQMKKSDLILLPYSGKDYSQRTSGIFVEAITLGAIPVTTKGTWMAYELQRFDLAELIFTWEEPKILDQLCNLLINQEVKNKLEKMQLAYEKFHSLEGFAFVLQNLYTEPCSV